jgi:hypothetical protein
MELLRHRDERAKRPDVQVRLRAGRLGIHAIRMLNERDQVLDVTVVPRDARNASRTLGQRTEARPKVRSDTMIDPAALGTLIVGLDAHRHDEARSSTVARPRRAQVRRAHTRQRLAAALRGMAARIEPAGLPAR